MTVVCSNSRHCPSDFELSSSEIQYWVPGILCEEPQSFVTVVCCNWLEGAFEFENFRILQIQFCTSTIFQRMYCVKFSFDKVDRKTNVGGFVSQHLQ